MKTIQATAYEAFDFTRFATESECREYEALNVHKRLASKTAEQIFAALTYADIDIAEALEQAGEQCKRARIKAGDYRRVPSGKKAAGNGAKVSGAPPERGTDNTGDDRDFDQIEMPMPGMEGTGT